LQLFIEGVDSAMSEPRLVILETSCQAGHVALARGREICGARRLDEARRHARDLIPSLKNLLDAQGWRAGDLNAVIVSRGPGSYTGLRVGLMTAKTLAYATGCALLAIDTFAAIAAQTPDEALRVDVLADAQKDRVYLQRFGRDNAGGAWLPLAPFAIQPFADWQAGLENETWVSGPGLRGNESRLDERRLVEAARREPLPESLLRLGLDRFKRGERDDFWTLEPLYLRPSAAEEKRLGNV
jgi:tRNA threonylcarbamoyladenosine biosynthesis protein TsaB